MMAAYVHPLVWGRRFGERLMREALEQLQSSDLDPVVLWIIEGNHRAMAFYERLSFARDGAIRHAKIGEGQGWLPDEIRCLEKPPQFPTLCPSSFPGKILVLGLSRPTGAALAAPCRRGTRMED